MKRRLFIVMVIAFAFSGNQHGNDGNSGVDTSYYVSLKDQLSIYSFAIIKTSAIELRNSEGIQPIQFKPNENLNLGLGFNYSWMGLGVAFNLGFLNDDNDIYGRTRGVDLQSDIFTRKLLFAAYLQAYSGFYWENIDDYDSTWNVQDSVLLRPDIITLNLGVDAIYTFKSDKFSFRSSYAFTEWQKRSAGSWLLGGEFSLYALQADAYLIPSQVADLYPNFQNFHVLNKLSAGLGVGYTYTYVLRKTFFVNATLMLGASIQGIATYDHLGNELSNSVRPAARSNLRISLGYNDNRYYYGMSIVSNSTLINGDFGTELSYSYGRVRIFYGRHFKIQKKTKN